MIRLISLEANLYKQEASVLSELFQIISSEIKCQINDCLFKLFIFNFHFRASGDQMDSLTSS